MRYGDPAVWRRFLEKRGIDPELADAWSRFARSNIRLIPSSLDEDTTPPGTSKLGGLPDLPDGVAWPTRGPYAYTREEDDYRPPEAWETQSLSFLAQINLADVAAAGCDLPLPSAGLLLFFYDAEVQPWGSEPFDAPGTQVLFVRAGTATRRPVQGVGRWSPVRPLQLQPSQGLPEWSWLKQEMKGDSGYGVSAFHDELGKLSEEDHQEILFEGHAFGGWPCEVQGPMEIECEMVRHGLNPGQSEAYGDPRMATLRERAKDWRLLLQLDSDEALDWLWGDCGKLYFWCREEDLAQRRFERAWTILQCT
ncbi:YwqG family protein [Reyranella sp.]|uniref:YwqG family protein n=1 Tax=Reyranella sp. TaxID=1929291 RepID=UPI003BADB80A